jgi:ATP-dependent Zn protease
VNYINFIHNAQHIALKDNSDFIDLKHLYQALADQEKSYFQWILNLSKFVYGDNLSTMYHEAGHVLLAMKKNTGRSVSYVTVLPRSFYGGKVSMQEHYKDITQNDLQLEHDIMMYLAGGVCEQIFGFPKKTTWDDMDAGFLDLLGRHGIAIDLDLAQERARLLIKDKDTLDEIIINQQVELILKDCYIKTFNYISENKSDIICIVDLLRKKGIISSKELQTLLDNNE